MADLESLLELASILEQQTDFKEVLRLVAQKSASLMEAETALVMMINPSTRETVKTIYREDKGAEDKRHQFVHTYFSGWVIDNRQAFFSGDIHEDGRFNRDVLKDLSLKSVMCAPLTAEGMITGSLLLLNRLDGGAFTKNDFDFLKNFTSVVSPFLRNIQKIQQYFTPVIPQATLLKKYEAHGLIGKSKAFMDLLVTVEAAARCDVRVLLEGASGTGKELIAKAIHQYSSRMQKKFIAIDCGAIPVNLIESELFGHVKGAFTGAAAPRRGLMEEAHGGTLFMDEITNLPLEMQAKLLRVLQEGEIRPVGSNETRKVDARIIAASSTSLRQLVAAGKFREDLFYRLYVYPIPVPSLADRRDDIPLLADYFLKDFSRKQRRNIEAFHEELAEFLKCREWPGNVRELENFVERLVALAPADTKVLDRNVLPEEFRIECEKMKIPGKQGVFQKPLKNLLLDYEKQVIQKILDECDGNQSKAARILKISEHTMRYKMDRLKIVKSPDEE
jgi:transcriptional regulator with GAF, ATPase, and Fis domain